MPRSIDPNLNGTLPDFRASEVVNAALYLADLHADEAPAAGHFFATAGLWLGQAVERWAAETARDADALHLHFMAGPGPVVRLVETDADGAKTAEVGRLSLEDFAFLATWRPTEPAETERPHPGPTGFGELQEHFVQD